MSEQSDPLADFRVKRDSAKSAVAAHLEGLKDGLQSRPVSKRLADEALSRARSAADEAKAVALDNKGVIAATAAALAAWILREPLQRGLERLRPVVAGQWSRLWSRLRPHLPIGHGDKETDDA